MIIRNHDRKRKKRKKHFVVLISSHTYDLCLLWYYEIMRL